MEPKKNSPAGVERRSHAFEMRSDKTKDGKRIVRGHGAVYNSLSEDLGGFREMIAPGAFDKAVNDDIFALFNHNPDILLGRTTAGTLKVTTDDRGLAYELTLPDTVHGRDLETHLDLGNITQSSFAMTVKRDRWEDMEDGTVLRTILEVGNLYDVSPVTYPAYREASVSIARRSFKAFQEQKEIERMIKESEQEPNQEEPQKESPSAVRQRQLTININQAGLPALNTPTDG